MNLPIEIETEILRSIGLEERELVADPMAVSVELRKMLPPSAREFIAGEIPRNGFGIGGKAGVGKTCAMVGFFRLHLRSAYTKRRESNAPRQDPKELRSKFRWVDWPRMAHELRTFAVADPEWVRRTVESLSKVPVLVLDDLGAERRKGEYQDDYAASELDYIVASTRYRACLPTWYTTNLDAAALSKFYGSRFVSRLVSESPLLELLDRDRRSVP